MQSRRIIISVTGVLLFLLAGGVAMFVLPSESPNMPVKNQPAPSVNQTPQNSTPSALPQPPQNSAPSAIPQSPSAPTVWYVYVTGEVKNQGLYAVSPDSRVFQAINAAGGLTRKADKASLNLAALLADEAHVHVPAKVSQTSGTAPQAQPIQTVRVPGYAQSGTSSRAGIYANTVLVDVNRADVHELQRINGVGQVIAQRIIDYRNSHGAFTSIDDLQKVKGIGQARLEQIRPQVTIQGGSSYSGGITYPQKSQLPSGNSSLNTNLIDINHASQSELQRLSGIGQAIAKRIIDYRNSHGSFTRVEDLLHVKGIGAKTLERIRSQVVIR